MMSEEGVVLHKAAVSQLGNEMRLSKAFAYMGGIRTAPLVLKWVIHGQEVYLINGERCVLRSGDVLIANAAAGGFVNIDSPQAVTGLCIDFSLEQIQRVLDALALSNTAASDYVLSPDLYMYQNAQNRNELISQLASLHWLINCPSRLATWQDDSFYDLICQALITALIANRKQLKKLPVRHIKTANHLLRKLSMAHNYILQHSHEKLNIAELSQHCALSEFHFIRTFKHVYDTSPYQLHMRVRMEKAREQLAIAPVSAVAQNLGFYDSRALARAYKKHFGVAPGQHRKS